MKDEDVGATQYGVFRTYDSRGNPTRITRHGVTETYTYDSEGNVRTRTNARGFTWTYSNYRRGIPQTENHPEGVTITRVVNSTGTIASETNGRGYTTSYTYDGLNRPTSIQRPPGDVISIAWSSSGRTVTRGTYSQAVTFDGFGRVSYIDVNGVTKDINYNVIGYKSFESYYSTTAGDAFGTDVLGRVTSVTYADGTRRTFGYSGNAVIVTNERGYQTRHSHRSYGDPDKERFLMRIEAPEGVITDFARNLIGQPLSVTQGGLTRSYAYHASNFLVSETNPETGTTVYGRDEVGNMTSRQVGSSPVTTYHRYQRPAVDLADRRPEGRGGLCHGLGLRLRRGGQRHQPHQHARQRGQQVHGL